MADSSPAPGSEDKRFLSWIREKHTGQNPEFVDELIASCANEFASHAHMSEDERADVYKSVRARLEAQYESHIRKLTRVRCCS